MFAAIHCMMRGKDHERMFLYDDSRGRGGGRVVEKRTLQSLAKRGADSTFQSATRHIRQPQISRCRRNPKHINDYGTNAWLHSCIAAKK